MKNTVVTTHRPSYPSLVTKLFLLLLGVIYSFVFNDPTAHFFLFVITVASIKTTRIPFGIIRSILPLLPILLLMTIFAGFSPTSFFEQEENRNVLFTFGTSLMLTSGGIKLGFTFTLRLINMVLMSKCLLHQANPDELVQWCSKCHLPYALAFTLSIALRFIPELEKKRQQMIIAQRIRGVDFEAGNFLAVYFRHVKLMIPLIINAILMAEQLTVTLYCRGFGYSRYRTELQSVHFNRCDYLLIIVGSMAMAGMIGAKVYGNWGRL